MLTALHCTALGCTALFCTVLRRTALHCTCNILFKVCEKKKQLPQPFKCIICGASFPTKRGKTSHMNYHQTKP